MLLGRDTPVLRVQQDVGIKEATGSHGARSGAGVQLGPSQPITRAHTPALGIKTIQQSVLEPLVACGFRFVSRQILQEPFHQG